MDSLTCKHSEFLRNFWILGQNTGSREVSRTCRFHLMPMTLLPTFHQETPLKPQGTESLTIESKGWTSGPHLHDVCIVRSSRAASCKFTGGSPPSAADCMQTACQRRSGYRQRFTSEAGRFCRVGFGDCGANRRGLWHFASPRDGKFALVLALRDPAKKSRCSAD